MDKTKLFTFLLRIVIYIVGVLILAAAIFLLPDGMRGAAREYPASVYLPMFLLIYASAIPFYYALYQTHRMLGMIDRNSAFSDIAVKALRNIKYAALAVGVMYIATWPFMYVIADREDAPGILAIGIVIATAAWVVAMFAAVLQMVLENAVNIKTENDLTV